MKKFRLLGLIFTLCMCFAIAMPAMAADDVLSFDVQNKMLRILSSVEEEKEYYNLENIDFSAIQIGREIPVYNVDDDDLIYSDLHFFPIINNNRLVSFFYVVNDNNEEAYVQLSNDLVIPISQYVVGNQPFAIIYDDDGAYVYVDNEIYLLGEAEQHYLTEEEIVLYNNLFGECPYEVESSVTLCGEEKNYISSIEQSVFQSINTESLSNNIILNADSFLQEQPLAITSKYLGVDILTEPANVNTCWAVAVASIVNYIYDGNWDYQGIVNMFTNGNDIGLHIDTVIDNMNYWFNAGWSYGRVNSLSPQTVLDYLIEDYPLYGNFKETHYVGGSAVSTAHAVVIRGVNTSSKTFSVMNPTPTTSGYTPGTISSDNVWKFVNSYGGTTYTLNAYGFPVLY